MPRKTLITTRRGLEANLTTGTLADGEFAITTDTKKLFVGIGGQNVCIGGVSSLGDMLKSVYDTNNNGIVDKAENSNTLGGRSPSDFAYSIIGGTDLNTITQSGMYRINNSLANAPIGVEYGQLLVVHGGGDTITQIVTDYSSKGIYWRSGNPGNVGGNGAWGSWKRLWHDGDFNPNNYMIKGSVTWNQLGGK